MSVIIKSNNVATKSMGNLKMLETTPQAEFDKYKARVIADGGVIRDEARTLRAFEVLFDSNLYGSINTFVSGSFGLKLDGNSIQKAYAIDGHDLVAYILGGGVAPNVTGDNAIDFSVNTNTSGSTGVMLSTENRVKLMVGNNFGSGVRVKDMPTTGLEYFSGFTKHKESTNEYSAYRMRCSFDDRVEFQVVASPLDLINTKMLDTMSLISNPSLRYFNTYLYVGDEGKSYGYRDGVLSVERVLGKAGDFSGVDLFLDFGGYDANGGPQYYRGALYDFVSYKHASKEQVRKLSTFD